MAKYTDYHDSEKNALAAIGSRLYATSSRWWQPSNSSLGDWRSHLLEFLILVVISFVMLWLADKLSSQGMAITRYMATVQAPVTGRLYPEMNRDQIAVMVYDDAFISESGGAWPIPYGDHADWLMRLVDNSAIRPKAIFLDITFVQERDDSSLPQLQSALCALQNDMGIPVFLAALVSPVDGLLHVRADLEATRDSEGRACFTLVSVEHNQDPIDRQTWSYPLTTHIANGVRVAGPAPDSNLPAYRSAAMVMAHHVAQLDLGPEEAPLALVWGATTTEQHNSPEFLMHCRQGPRSIMPSVPNVVRQLWDNEPKQPICPYHHALSMAQVAQMDEDQLAPYVAGRYLLIGAAISGQNDLAYSPVHGLLPGVYVHAMALDNLLTYGKQYKQHSEWRWPLSASMLLSGLTAIAVVFLIHLMFRALRAKLQPHIQQHGSLRLLTMSANELDEANLGTRLLTVPIRLVIWLLRLSLQATAAVLLIAFLQWQFRIGMLPVVELIGMTLLAEGLNYMDKVRLFLFGKTAGAAQ